MNEGKNFGEDVPLWLSGDWDESDFSDIVVSAEVKINRNIAGWPFACSSDARDAKEILRLAEDAVDGLGMLDVDLESAPIALRMFYRERRLISTSLAYGIPFTKLFYEPDESSSVAINEEDHIRIRHIVPGFGIQAAISGAAALEAAIGESVDFANSKEFGYLTACYAEAGSGMRISALVHLPALVLWQEGTQLSSYAQSRGVSISGGFGDDIMHGNFFHVYAEPDRMENVGSASKAVEDVLKFAVKREKKCRRQKMPDDIMHLLGCSFGNLKYGYATEYAAAANQISCCILASKLGLCNISANRWKTLMAWCMPGHLMLATNPDDVDRLEAGRATKIREAISGVDKFRLE